MILLERKIAEKDEELDLKSKTISSIQTTLSQLYQKIEDLNSDLTKSRNLLEKWMEDINTKEKENYELTALNRNLNERLELLQKQIATQNNFIEEIKKGTRN